ncbi:hypothetical protein NC651_018770 [Populus alba x Populus x berolinensis]|nr:hypothetical protein NC651_018770 [Populus alba x Populus x berolinensis]
MTFNSVDMLTPSLLSHYNNNPLTSLPPPPASNFTNFLNGDGMHPTSQLNPKVASPLSRNQSSQFTLMNFSPRSWTSC